jgi:hypothetical protein
MPQPLTDKFLCQCLDLMGQSPSILRRIRSKQRHGAILNPRVDLIHILVDLGYSDSEIGRAINRDRTSICHHRKKLEGENEPSQALWARTCYRRNT